METPEERAKFRKDRNDKVNEYIEKVIKPLLPNFSVKSISSLAPHGGAFGQANIDHADTNSILRKSKYYYSKKPLFIHYTSLDNLVNILNERSIRMYSLSHMEDPLELSYAFPGGINFNNEYFKDNIFTLSMCSLDLEYKNESFDLWRNFGRNGSGVGIVLDFSNQKSNWLYFLSKVHYGDNSKLSVDQFVERHNKFTNDNNFNISNFTELSGIVPLLCSFHKPDIYRNENEIRLTEKVIRRRFEKPNNFIKASINPRTKARSYYTLLSLDRQEYMNSALSFQDSPKLMRSFLSIIPDVKIQKVILGYNYTKEDTFSIYNTINHIISSYHPEIEVELTGIKKYFD